MKNRIQVIAVIAFALGLASSLASAADSQPYAVAATALDDAGNLYQVLTGARRDLFPETAAEDAGNRVLALDVVRSDGTHGRTLLPGTGGPEVEGTPSAVFEDDSQRLYVVWESKKSPTVSRLLLASFDGDGWSDTIEISGDVAPLKDEPKVLISRDRFSLTDATGELHSRARTVIHVLWREEDVAGSRLFYTPVILDAGTYLGWNPVIPLTDFEPTATKAQEPVESAELLRTPVLTAGRDINSAIVAFASPTTGRLITLEVRLLPGELGFLADYFRGQILAGAPSDQGEIESLAERFRGHIIDIGDRLNQGTVQVFAERASQALRDLYEADPQRPVSALADKFRGHIIDIGLKLMGGPGLQAAPSKLVELDPSGDQGGTQPVPSVTDLLHLQVIANRPAPPLGGIPAHIFVSEDGEQLLVGWLDHGEVYYTESGEDTADAAGGKAWTPVKHLTLSERLGIPEAAAILEARVKRQR